MHVHWQEGLFLQPHHLQIMQRRLQADIRAARALLTPYCYGVVECRLSQRRFGGRKDSFGTFVCHHAQRAGDFVSG